MLSKALLRTPWRRFLWYHLPAILFAVAIFAVSSIPDLKGPDLKIVPFDKLAHFLEYAVFAYLIFRSLSQLTATTANTTVFILSLLLLGGFAALDEFHQKFVPGRTCDIADFATDLVGAVLVLLYFVLRRTRLSRSSKY
jgi:VanZ family protein